MKLDCKILYVCEENSGTTKHRLIALKEIVDHFEIIYTVNLQRNKINFFLNYFYRVLHRLRIPASKNNENKKILKLVETNCIDVIFIEKGLTIRPRTLRTIKNKYPKIKIISYLLDDIENPANNSYYLRNSIPFYDLCCTNKKHNMDYYKHKGAKEVYYFKNGYSELYHKKNNLKKQYDVSFIGTYEKERFEFLKYLGHHGIKVAVFGWAKPQTSNRPTGLDFHNKHVYDEEFTEVINRSKVNLCFLRKINRDTETTRSIEIPACGGFMLAERTKDHLETFKEKECAEYFSSKEEMLEKIIQYVSNDELREQIANNGFHETRRLGLGYERQLKYIFSHAIEKC